MILVELRFETWSGRVFLMKVAGHKTRSVFEGFAPVAQWIEHRIPNPCAASSILAGGTKEIKGLG